VEWNGVRRRIERRGSKQDGSKETDKSSLFCIVYCILCDV
jgi:hypothetical protein